MWFDMILMNVLTILKQIVKNKAKKKELKGRLLNIRDAISALYPGE